MRAEVKVGINAFFSPFTPLLPYLVVGGRGVSVLTDSAALSLGCFLSALLTLGNTSRIHSTNPTADPAADPTASFQSAVL